MEKRLILASILSLPLAAQASDPTPLIEIFFEWPLLFFSSLLFFIALRGWRNALSLNLALFTFQLLILWWLTSADYMKNNGEIIWIALTINAAAIGLAIQRLYKRKVQM